MRPSTFVYSFPRDGRSRAGHTNTEFVLTVAIMINHTSLHPYTRYTMSKLEALHNRILETLISIEPQCFSFDDTLWQHIPFANKIHASVRHKVCVSLRERVKGDSRFTLIPPNSFHITTRYGCHSLPKTSSKLIMADYEGISYINLILEDVGNVDVIKHLSATNSVYISKNNRVYAMSKYKMLPPEFAEKFADTEVTADSATGL